jgi:hypothetical protein
MAFLSTLLFASAFAAAMSTIVLTIRPEMNRILHVLRGGLASEPAAMLPPMRGTARRAVVTRPARPASGLRAAA